MVRVDFFDLQSPFFLKGFAAKKIINILSTYFLIGQNSDYTPQEAEQILVFEGMFDYLSYLAYRKTTFLDTPVCILHSLINLTRLIDFLADNQITTMLSYFDNDDSGKQGVATLSCHFGKNHIPMNNLYQGFKDLNEWWVQTSF